jgi:hypothetical protein
VLVGYTVSVLLTALRPPPPAAGQP